MTFYCVLISEMWIPAHLYCDHIINYFEKIGYPSKERST